MHIRVDLLRRWLLVMLLCGLLAAAPVYAQDEEATEEPAAAEEAGDHGDETTGESAAEEGEDHGDEQTGDAEEAEEEEGPAGVEILFLLLGIAAVLVVGGAAIGQEAFRNAEAEQDES